MAHELESMFYVGEVPWHGLGKQFPIKTDLSVSEAINAAGLNWWVEQRELKTADGLPVKDFKANVRVSDEQVLGVVGEKYKPVQNIDCFKWFQPFIDSKLAKFESAGSLRGGRVIWVLAKLNRANSIVRNDDEILKYVLLANSHDGSITLRLGLTPVRVVCMNTLSASLQKGDHLISLRHSNGILDNMEKVQEMVQRIDSQFEQVTEAFRYLASVEIDDQKLEDYVRACFGLKDKETEEEDKEEEESRIVASICKIFHERRYGSTEHNTWWEGYNALTEFLSHVRGRTPLSRLDSVWFGNSELINRRALRHALAMAAGK